MGYYDKTGVIGTWKNMDVYAIPYVLFKEEEADDPSTIFAVKPISRFEYMTLVYRGYIVGYMTDDGEIKVDARSKAFEFYKKPSVKVRVAEEKIETDEPQEIDFAQYTKVVDDFFEGLNELWKEMET